MKREININDITEDKLFTCNDLAKIGCGDCKGCHSCCIGMGGSIILDPYDVFNLTRGLDCDFVSLLNGKVQLNVVDGVILPNLAMAGDEEKCQFLSDEGRCSIHTFRPGICRLFPLGRIYENGSFKYFVQSGECKKENRTKVKVKSFLGIADIKNYEEFVTRWHYFLNRIEEKISEYATLENSEVLIKDINMWILNVFYITSYNDENFYEEAYRRIKLTESKYLEANNEK